MVPPLLLHLLTALAFNLSCGFHEGQGALLFFGGLLTFPLSILVLLSGLEGARESFGPGSARLICTAALAWTLVSIGLHAYPWVNFKAFEAFASGLVFCH
ncbi:hypothetical protein OOT46_27990 [Aquabacterium sp. A7-Y]|uniref:hypothetical protein n=1 Tax=Aquabacterium sp. A7-Y TaxID=1349605 RepID=UPI00223E3044|nr:hypothetical protein [Aquabacterium sp. A7-Y]MCW7541645.1 hypothetical protein [Aquabacterium sp. A7-Y]